MNITKLLGGVAVAALIGSGAHAQVTLAREAGTNALFPLSDGTNAATAFIHSEFQPAAAAGQLKGDVVITPTFTVGTWTSVGIGNRLALEVELGNAGWGTPQAGSGTDGGASLACKFVNTADGGGGTGNTKLTFKSTTGNAAGSDINDCAGAGPTFTFPDVTRKANGSPVTVKFTFTEITPAGAAVVGGATATKTITLADVKPSWATVSNNHKVSKTDIVVPNDGKFAATGDQNLGTVQVSFTAQFNTGTVGVPALRDIRDKAGAALAAADDLIGTGSKLTLTFPQGTSGFSQTANDFKIAGALGTACAAPVTTTAPAQTVTCTLLASEVAGLTTASAITGKKVTDKTVVAQTVTAALSVVSKTDIAPLSGPSGTIAVITVDDGRLPSAELITGNKGRWVAFGAGGTESAFRISGLKSAETAKVEAIRFTVADGGNAVPVAPATPGYYELTNTGDPATGFRVRGGTITFNSKALGVAAGLGTTTGNADITSLKLRYVGTSVPTVVMDRQLANRNPTSIVAVPNN